MVVYQKKSIFHFNAFPTSAAAGGSYERFPGSDVDDAAIMAPLLLLLPCVVVATLHGVCALQGEPAGGRLAHQGPGGAAAARRGGNLNMLFSRGGNLNMLTRRGGNLNMLTWMLTLYSLH